MIPERHRLPVVFVKLTAGSPQIVPTKGETIVEVSEKRQDGVVDSVPEGTVGFQYFLGFRKNTAGDGTGRRNQVRAGLFGIWTTSPALVCGCCSKPSRSSSAPTAASASAPLRNTFGKSFLSPGSFRFSPPMPPWKSRSAVSSKRDSVKPQAWFSITPRMLSPIRAQATSCLCPMPSQCC